MVFALRSPNTKRAKGNADYTDAKAGALLIEGQKKGGKKAGATAAGDVPVAGHGGARRGAALGQRVCVRPRSTPRRSRHTDADAMGHQR